MQSQGACGMVQAGRQGSRRGRSSKSGLKAAIPARVRPPCPRPAVLLSPTTRFRPGSGPATEPDTGNHGRNAAESNAVGQPARAPMPKGPAKDTGKALCRLLVPSSALKIIAPHRRFDRVLRAAADWAAGDEGRAAGRRRGRNGCRPGRGKSKAEVRYQRPCCGCIRRLVRVLQLLAPPVDLRGPT